MQYGLCLAGSLCCEVVAVWLVFGWQSLLVSHSLACKGVPTGIYVVATLKEEAGQGTMGQRQDMSARVKGLNGVSKVRKSTEVLSGVLLESPCRTSGGLGGRASYIAYGVGRETLDVLVRMRHPVKTKSGWVEDSTSGWSSVCYHWPNCSSQPLCHYTLWIMVSRPSILCHWGFSQ